MFFQARSGSADAAIMEIGGDAVIDYAACKPSTLTAPLCPPRRWG